MKRHIKLLPLAGLLMIVGLSACSTSKNQNPVSGEEVGKVSDSGEEKPTTYTAKEGDTLRKIAGRSDIYGDPNLWPILQEANSDLVGQGMRVNKGVELKIPRDLSDEQKEMAHEKARQMSAANKMSSRPAKRAEPTEVPATAGPGSTPVPTAVPAQPVPQAKKSSTLLTMLFVLLLVLAALAVVLFYFMKKEKKEESQD